jgi:uncharacterized protein YlxW (UPF0749 family)
MTVVFILIGILLSLQFQAQNRFASDLSMQRTENLIAMVRDLSEKRQKLAIELIDLNSKLRAQAESDRDEKKLVESLKEELTKMKMVNGTIELRGPGLQILIEKHLPILYIDIIHIVNELWAAGAEAISVNDCRITSSTAIFYTEDSHSMSITVDNIKLEYPIIIRAIGEPNNLEKGLTIPGGIMDNLALFNAYPLLTKVDEQTIPAVHELPHFYFASEYKPLEKPAASNTQPAARP